MCNIHILNTKVTLLHNTNEIFQFSSYVQVLSPYSLSLTSHTSPLISYHLQCQTPLTLSLVLRFSVLQLFSSEAWCSLVTLLIFCCLVALSPFDFSYYYYYYFLGKVKVRENFCFLSLPYTDEGPKRKFDFFYLPTSMHLQLCALPENCKSIA